MVHPLLVLQLSRRIAKRGKDWRKEEGRRDEGEIDERRKDIRHLRAAKPSWLEWHLNPAACPSNRSRDCVSIKRFRTRTIVHVELSGNPRDGFTTHSISIGHRADICIERVAIFLPSLITQRHCPLRKHMADSKINERMRELHCSRNENMGGISMDKGAYEN